MRRPLTKTQSGRGRYASPGLAVGGAPTVSGRSAGYLHAPPQYGAVSGGGMSGGASAGGGGGAGTMDHAALSHLDYAAAAHTGFEPTVAAGIAAQYYRGDKTWATLNQSAVAGLTNADSPTFAGLTLDALSGFLVATGGVVSATPTIPGGSVVIYHNQMDAEFGVPLQGGADWLDEYFHFQSAAHRELANWWDKGVFLGDNRGILTGYAERIEVEHHLGYTTASPGAIYVKNVATTHDAMVWMGIENETLYASLTAAMFGAAYTDVPEFTNKAAVYSGSAAAGLMLMALEGHIEFWLYDAGYGGDHYRHIANVTYSGIMPFEDSTYDLGGAGPLYWANVYTDTLHLNSTAYLDAAVAGTAVFHGSIFEVYNSAADARLIISPDGAQGRRSILTFQANFMGTGDNIARRAADIVGGYDAAAWTTEYLAFGVGFGGANDAYLETIERMRLTATALHPAADSTCTLGTAALYWSNAFADRVYLSGTAYLDGATANRVDVYATNGIVAFNGANWVWAAHNAADAAFRSSTNTFAFEDSGGTYSQVQVNVGSATAGALWVLNNATAGAYGGAASLSGISIAMAADVGHIRSNCEGVALRPLVVEALNWAVDASGYGSFPRLYVNATAYFSGANAGRIGIVGTLDGFTVTGGGVLKVDHIAESTASHAVVFDNIVAVTPSVHSAAAAVTARNDVVTASVNPSSLVGILSEAWISADNVTVTAGTGVMAQVAATAGTARAFTVGYGVYSSSTAGAGGSIGTWYGYYMPTSAGTVRYGVYIADSGAGNTVLGWLNVGAGGLATAAGQIGASRYYLNSTAYLDGTNAGRIGITGTVDSFSMTAASTLTGITVLATTLGGSAAYVTNLYATRHYLNATSYLDGATAGVAKITGKVAIGGRTPAAGTALDISVASGATDILVPAGTWTVINGGTYHTYTGPAGIQLSGGYGDAGVNAAAWHLYALQVGGSGANDLIFEAAKSWAGGVTEWFRFTSAGIAKFTGQVQHDHVGEYTAAHNVVFDNRVYVGSIAAPAAGAVTSVNAVITNADSYGVHGLARGAYAAGAYTHYVWGLLGQAEHTIASQNLTTAAGGLAGVYGRTYITADTVTVTHGVGVWGSVQTTAGTARAYTTACYFYGAGALAAGGTIATLYGLYIATGTTAGTAKYGVYIADNAMGNTFLGWMNVGAGTTATATGQIGALKVFHDHVGEQTGAHTIFFDDSISIADAKDITLNATTGTKLGTATTEKLGFWNHAPAVQPAHVADATDAASVILRLNDLLARLEGTGILAAA